MALVASPLVDGVFDEDRLRVAILGRLRDAALMAGLYGKQDDNTTSLLHAMVKASFVVVVDKEDRAKLDQDEVVPNLGRMLQENQRKLGSLNDALLSAVGEVLHYALEKWPRDNLKCTTNHADVSGEREIRQGNLEGEAIDPIDVADEEKAIPFLALADLPQGPIEREKEQDVPIEDTTMEGVLPEEETEQTNLFHDNAHPAKKRDTVKEENHEDMDVVGNVDLHLSEDNDGGIEGEEYDLNSGGEDDGDERKVQSGAVADSQSQEAKKKIETVKHQDKSSRKSGIYKRGVAKGKLAALNPADYEYDEKASENEGRFKCTRCGKRFPRTRPLISHMNLHTGEIPYQCTACPKRYSKLNSLDWHVKYGCKGRSNGQKNTGRKASGRE